MSLQILRDGAVMDVSVTPENGRIGITNKTIVQKLGFVDAVARGLLPPPRT